MIDRHKSIIISFLVGTVLLFSGCHKTEIKDLDGDLKIKASEISGSDSVPNKEEVIRQIDIGISIIEESIENFVKEKPGRKPEEKLNNNGESSLKEVQMLRQLEKELKNNEISAEDAWKRCLEIRDGKKK